jgi:uroporphyrin-III C-methyltransferase/precorrin-2 dehydrogenase/sirohydrochlorin ferrochelatase/uroporphyrin-III C-methyltransferase
MSHKGMVYLVGAGPGDPDLLTRKALRVLHSVDVVVYDRLVSDEILDEIPVGVSRISVAKSAGRHSMQQSEIDALVVRLALSGRSVARLKGGDPYLFGRGGEEALALKRNGIRFVVVPGVTAATGCGAYAGIPLSHRGMSRSVHFLTAHFKNDEPLDIDWRRIADADATLVFYMGLGSLSTICDGLRDAGLAPDTQAAAVENATTVRQRRVLSTLEKLPEAVAGAGLRAPVMIIVGRVVSLADTLNWFERESEGLVHAPDTSVHA